MSALLPALLLRSTAAAIAAAAVAVHALFGLLSGWWPKLAR